jgi:DNA-binding MarR family transcriptional regulator
MTGTAGDDEEDVPPDVVDAVVEQWVRERADIDPASIGIFGRVARVHQLECSIVRDLHDSHGLTLAAFDVLSNLRRAGPPHRKTAGELAESSMLTSGGVTFRIDKLESEGLVRRVRSTDDRRVVYAELTDAGRKKIDAVYEEHIALENDMLARLTAQEREQLVALLRKLSYSVIQVDSEGTRTPVDL